MKKILTLLVLAITLSASAEDFHIAPAGRVLIDAGGTLSSNHDLQKAGATIPDVSLGAVMNMGKWDVRIDVGFNDLQLGLRDAFFRYSFDSRMQLKIGHFHQPYGLQSATSSTFKYTTEQPLVNRVLNEDRQLGAALQYTDSLLFAAFSAHADTKSALGRLAIDNGRVAEGYGVQTRLAVHPVCRPGRLVQVGISGGVSFPQRRSIDGGSDRVFTYQANLPTRLFNRTALSAEVDYARNSWQFSPELLLAYGPVALESQYYFRQVNRDEFDGRELAMGFSNGRPFRSYGTYAIVRGLIIGGDYAYSTATASLANPKKGLELVGMYNYVCLSDAKAEIIGGRANGFSATMNWYINRFMILRLHYSHTKVWDRSGYEDGRTLDVVTARLQVNF